MRDATWITWSVSWWVCRIMNQKVQRGILETHIPLLTSWQQSLEICIQNYPVLISNHIIGEFGEGMIQGAGRIWKRNVEAIAVSCRGSEASFFFFSLWAHIFFIFALPSFLSFLNLDFLGFGLYALFSPPTTWRFHEGFSLFWYIVN